MREVPVCQKFYCTALSGTYPSVCFLVEDLRGQSDQVLVCKLECSLHEELLLFVVRVPDVHRLIRNLLAVQDLCNVVLVVLHLQSKLKPSVKVKTIGQS